MRWRVASNGAGNNPTRLTSVGLLYSKHSDAIFAAKSRDRALWPQVGFPSPKAYCGANFR